MLHISLAAENLWTVAGLPISNAFLTTFLVMFILFAFAFFATRTLSLVPSTLQLIAESIVGGLYDFFNSIAGKHIQQFFPLVATFFIFILVANWVGLLPGVGTIGFFHAKEAPIEQVETVETVTSVETVDEHAAPVAVTDEHGDNANEEASTTGHADGSTNTHDKPAFTPLFRAATADLNMTLALAIVSVIAMQYFGFKNLGAHYSSRFINFKDPIMFGVGLLELASDISKIVSFAFRLFGNVFAGEVLLMVIAFLMPFIVPLPFLFMELFVGLVQALVFSMLSTAFFNVAVSHGDEEHEETAAVHASS